MRRAYAMPCVEMTPHEARSVAEGAATRPRGSAWHSAEAYLRWTGRLSLCLCVTFTEVPVGPTLHGLSERLLSAL